jgi:hypothetical protein
LLVAARLGEWLALLGRRVKLDGFAHELAGIHCPFVSDVSCFEAFPALPFVKLKKIKSRLYRRI